VSLSSGPRLLVEVGFDAATRLMTLDTASSWGEFWRSHMFHGTQRTMGHENKEGLGFPMQLGSHVSKARTCVTEVPTRCACRQRYYDLQDIWAGSLQDVQTCVYNAALALLTTCKTLLLCGAT
jgi:hypothetical protein